jgi:hypothetical protein
MNFYVPRKPKADTPEDLLAGTNALHAEDTALGEALRCPACTYPLTKLKWLPPYRIELETWGRVYGDFPDVYRDMIVSERFVQTFQASGLQGLPLFEPVEVVEVIHHRGRPEQPMPRYFKASVTLSPTTVDQRASGYVWEDESKICPVCLRGGKVQRYARVVVHQESWNGDDIFAPRGGPAVLVSERFKAFCETHGFLGIVFTPSEEHSNDFFPWKTQG